MDGTPEQNGNLRQPKKRFVGRRTADAQAKDASSNVETSVQKGMLDIRYRDIQTRTQGEMLMR